ncbi:ATP-binding cassette, subfamily B [Sanguibacter gelidistatuariae]|uniref:ATP-binding cassette, subfamily B n=1 Tax=Sanguibacter gelidistatuariae TaxID=1814289 RepID=A0A1G6N9U0_9MICO|nr:ABC transporter ATP-binding protein [Sanguibacter gelidistatuariae]SDC63915.1 ATP-binding cassette, subfamily B [Sanguibacter gelidistatuariae]
MRSIALILRATRVLWPFYLGIIVCSLIATAATLVIPFVLKAATDTVVDVVQGTAVGNVITTVVWLAVALLVADMVSSTVQNFGGYLGDVMAARMRQILSTRYFAKLLGLPQRYFDNQVTGSIISRLTRSISETTGFLNNFANNFFPMLLTVVAVLVISASYSWPIAVLLAVVFPIYVGLTAMTSKKWQVLEAEKNEQVDLAGGRFAEVVGQINVVKSFTSERRELNIFAGRFARTVVTTRDQSRYWHLMDAARRGFLNVVFFGIYVILFVGTAKGTFSVGDMVLLIQLVAMAKAPVTMMSYLIDTTQRAIAGSKDYFAVMAEPADRDEPLLLAETDTAPSADTGAPAATATAPGAASGARQAPPSGIDRLPDGAAMVELDGVTFAYDEGVDVLRDVSFTVRKGERVALVSESGGGKTTLVSLLLGFYRPTSGTLRVAGYDVADVPLDLLRRQVAVVFQEASLFSGTIRENIAYGREDASDAEIVEAATRAHAHGFVSAFGAGYETTIGERGLKLSGGQKQRIAVARAMIKDAPVLVLDEATSALDTKSERLVQAGLDELMIDRTTIIIAHRLSTISSVDTIITLRDGRVDEVGSPAELAVSGGIYSELLALQASSSLKDRKRLRKLGFMA